MSRSESSPAARPRPTFGSTVRLIASLSLTRLRRGRSLWFLGAVVLLVLVAVVGVRFGSGATARALWDKMFDWPIRRMLVFLAPFVLTATAFSEEVEGRTLVYLFSRPVSRSAILLGKYLTGAAASALVVIVAVTGTFAFAWLGRGVEVPWKELSEALLGTVLATGAYGAVFLFFDVILADAPYLLSILYVGLVELALSFVPGVVSLVSLNTHLGNLVGPPPEKATGLLSFWTPDVPGAASVAVLCIVGGIFLLGATSMVSGTEVKTGRA